jgi:hypothetical protein
LRATDFESAASAIPPLWHKTDYINSQRAFQKSKSCPFGIWRVSGFRPFRREFKIIERFAFKVKTEPEYFVNRLRQNHLFNILIGGNIVSVILDLAD